MKKANYIQLVLITAVLASCNRPDYWKSYSYDASRENADTCNTDSCAYSMDQDLWYYAFRPFFDINFSYGPGSYYYGNILTIKSGGHPMNKPSVNRGGFGKAGSAAS